MRHRSISILLLVIINFVAAYSLFAAFPEADIPAFWQNFSHDDLAEFTIPSKHSIPTEDEQIAMYEEIYKPVKKDPTYNGKETLIPGLEKMVAMGYSYLMHHAKEEKTKQELQSTWETVKAELQKGPITQYRFVQLTNELAFIVMQEQNVTDYYSKIT